VQRLLLAVMLLCVACESIESDSFDAGVMDAGEVLVDGSADDGGELIDKQNGYRGIPDRTQAQSDYLLLPHSIKIVPQLYDGWQSTSEKWMYAIWPRTGTVGGGGRPGAWYRGDALNAFDVYKRNILPGRYTCQSGFLLNANCANEFGARVSVVCPQELRAAASPREWRSGWTDADTQRYWYYWGFAESQKWASFADRISFPFAGVVVSGGTQVNCKYSPKPYGQYETVDSWLEVRAIVDPWS
jgi:hypothetical protein